MHEDPAQPWTVSTLARATGVSRSALARRFTGAGRGAADDVFSSWRLSLAADLLRKPGATVGSVARQVGYGSPYALTTAFKRVRGIRSQQHRALALQESSPAEPTKAEVRAIAPVARSP